MTDVALLWNAESSGARTTGAGRHDDATPGAIRTRFRCVLEGRYKDANEVLVAGLRLLAEREEEERLQLERLRAEVKKGMDDLEAGRYVEVNSDEELDAHFNRLNQEAIGRLRSGHDRVSPASTQ